MGRIGGALGLLTDFRLILVFILHVRREREGEIAREKVETESTKRKKLISGRKRSY